MDTTGKKITRLLNRTDSNDPHGLKYMSQVDEALNQRGHPWAFLLSMAVLLFFGVFIIWASFAELDEVTRGEGQVIPAAGVNPVQTDRGGKVERILVKENELVDRNQLVATISNTQEMAVLRDLQNKSIELTLAILRLDSEAAGIDLSFPQEIIDRYPDVVRAQTQIFQHRKQQFTGEDMQLAAQIEEQKALVSQSSKKHEDQKHALTLEMERERSMAPLVGRSVSINDYQEVKLTIVTLEGEVNAAQQAIAQAERGVREAEERRNARRAQRMAAIAEEKNKSRIEQDSVQEQLKISTDQVSNTELRAPISGLVKQILLKEGEVAKPADTILEIIPQDGVLEIEARFKPEDRGFLYVSQKATVKFVGYDFSIYGGLEADITRISEDTIEDKKGEPWYEVRFVTRKKFLEYQGQALEMHPGMPVSIDVLTDKRTVLDILLRPILRARDNAMTER